MSGKKKFSQTNSKNFNGIYKLIEFIAKAKCNGRSVDIVPCDWIVYDNVSGNLKTVFMPPPYTSQTTEALHSFVKNRAEPPKSWPSYEINIVGEAKTYELALIKLKKLEIKEYVYSTESDHGENRSLSDKKKYKLKATKADYYLEKTLLEVPPLHSDEDTCSQFSESSKESGIISNDENTKSRTIRTKECENTYNCSAKTVISKNVEKKSSKSNKQKKKVENCNTSEGHQYNDDNIISNTEHIEKNSSFCQFDERKDTTNDLSRLITSGFRSICTQLTQLTLNINELKNILSLEKNNNPQICTDIEFIEKHGIEFPCKTPADFMQFEEKLKSKAFRQDFELNLWKIVDTSATVLKSLTNILKKHMSRDLAMTFTAVKKMEGKQILKATIFSSCIQKVLVEEYSKLNTHPPITDKIYYSTLGSVLNNAKDWDGHRLLMRQKKVGPSVHSEDENESEV